MLLETAIAIAREAGALLREGFAAPRTIEHKSAVELVTDMDLASERLVLSRLGEHFPDHALLAEESGGHGGSLGADYCWAIDPLDGTNNYAHGYPVFCVSIALLERGTPLVGVVYDPLRDECFSAQRGQGAWCGQRALRVSGTAPLARALLSTGFPYDRFETGVNNVAELGRMVMRCQGIMRSGSLAIDLAYVAAGRCDGHWELGIKPWDIAAGTLLVAEAGGTLSNWQGGAWDVRHSRLVATNGLIHQEIVEVLGA